MKKTTLSRDFTLPVHCRDCQYASEFIENSCYSKAMGRRLCSSQRYGRVRRNYNKDMIRDIVYNIDDELPDDLKSNNSLSTERKELICKLIDERIKRLKDIVS